MMLVLKFWKRYTEQVLHIMKQLLNTQAAAMLVRHTVKTLEQTYWNFQTIYFTSGAEPTKIEKSFVYSLEEMRAKGPMKQPGQSPRPLLLCLHPAWSFYWERRAAWPAPHASHAARFSKAQVKGEEKHLLHLDKRNLHRKMPSSALAAEVTLKNFWGHPICKEIVHFKRGASSS